MKRHENRSLLSPRKHIIAAFVLFVALGAAGSPGAIGQVFVTGQLVNPVNVGVPFADIDFYDSSTGDPIVITNGGTDPNGFFDVGSPTGIFDIWFTPAAGSGLAPVYLLDVIVAGNVNLGVIQAPTGYEVSGIVESTTGSGIQAIDIDITDLATGIEMRLSADFTGPAGDWSFVLAAGTYDFEFDPTGLYGSTYAPGQFLDVAVSAPLDLGILELPPGNVLSGYVMDPFSSPVVNADTDVRDIYTGGKLYTPNDNTDSSGFFSVVVPAGTWDVEIDPPQTTKLVAEIIPGIVVNGSYSMGTISVESGFYLSGTVRDSNTLPVKSVDVDVVFNGWQEIVTPGDDTNSTGFYRVVVPAGTYLVEFTPPLGSGFAETAFAQVNISSDTILDATLSAATCPPPTNYGTGLEGTGGFVPVMGHGGGFPFIGNSIFGLTVTKALGAAPGYFVYGLSAVSIPYQGGTVLAQPKWRPPVNLGGTPGFAGGGGYFYILPIPNNPAYVNLNVYFQYVIVDAGAIQGFAFSDGLEITICL